jgi:GAF domain-containing protein
MRPRHSSLVDRRLLGLLQLVFDFWNSNSGAKGACGTALERGERVIVEDVEQSPVFAGTEALEIQIKAGVRAVQSTPLVSRWNGIGNGAWRPGWMATSPNQSTRMK